MMTWAKAAEGLAGSRSAARLRDSVLVPEFVPIDLVRGDSDSACAVVVLVQAVGERISELAMPDQ
jgi:hypothetical protein